MSNLPTPIQKIIGIAPKQLHEARFGHEKWIDDGQLHVILVGTGCPIFDVDRSGPCTAVIAGEHFFLVDTGPGTWEAVTSARLPIARLSGVLFTHYHSDHIGDLGEVMTQSWMANADKRTTKLPIYGGPGIADLANGFEEAYKKDIQHRVDHHSQECMPDAVAGVLPILVKVPEVDGDDLWKQEMQVPLLPAPSFNWKKNATQPSNEVVQITAFHVQHDPCKPAYGYKFEYRGKTVVVSGDTGYCPSIVHQSQNIDLLVHEACACHLIDRGIAMQKSMGNDRLVKMMTDLSQPNVHSSPETVMGIAKEANVRHLAYTHIVPPMRNLILRKWWAINIDASGWDGDYTIGEDGMHFCFPCTKSKDGGKMVMIDKTSGMNESRISPRFKSGISAVAISIMCYWLAPGRGKNKAYIVAVFLSLLTGLRMRGKV